MTNDTTPPRLRFAGVGKQYGSLRALADVDFDLRAHEVVALLGENGAGKSTMVKIMAGLTEPTSGHIEIDGQEIRLASSADAQAAGIAVVTQEFSLVPSMTIAENLSLGQIDSGVLWTRRKLRERALSALETVGLSDIDPDARIEELTVAERQLVEIARVVKSDAKVVIFDEPTATLSDREKDRVLDLVRRLASRGRSIVYVTHRMAEVFEISDRIQVMRNGRAEQPLVTADVDMHDVVRLMLGRELDDMFPERTAEDAPQGEPTLQIQELLTESITHPVTIDVPRGRILGLTGQVGSGASELLQGLAGLARWTEGSVRVDGEPIDLRGRARGIRQGVAYCSADRKRDGIFASLNVRENMSSAWLDSVSTGGWIDRKRELAEARSASTMFAIAASRFGADVGALSGGNQQKVALGKWLGARPRVLLADEPTRGVDVGARAEIYRKLRELADDGITVVIASTDTVEVLGLADVIATFAHGRITEVRDHRDWTAHELVAAVMHNVVATNGAAPNGAA